MTNHMYTMIKRGDAVLQSGVGSVIRTRHGLTGIVAGLPEWEMTLRRAFPDDEDYLDYIRKNSIRDPELEAATGVSSFLVPPRFDDDRGSRNWIIPLIRFPMAGWCQNWQCGRVSIAHQGDKHAALWKCPHCAKGKSFSRVQQVPVFLICPNGHIEEIDWSQSVVHNGGCTSDNIKLSLGGAIQQPVPKCLDCGGRSEGGFTKKCSGRRIWLPEKEVEDCSEEMELIERTSVTVYFPSMKSALHIPSEAEVDDRIVEFIRNRPNLLRRVCDTNTDSPKELEVVAEQLNDEGFSIDLDGMKTHVAHIRALEAESAADQWNVYEARLNEFDVLSGRKTYPRLLNNPLFTIETKDLLRYNHPLIGHDSLIRGVSAVHVLTETRVLDGFSRKNPRSVGRREGHQLLWGTEVVRQHWLPAYRVRGEGIFFEINPDVLANVPSERRIGVDGRPTVVDLSDRGVIAHTLAHILARELSLDSGYALPSIRDRIYDLDDERLGFLLYTAEGDSMGTMGGVVRFAQSGILEGLLDRMLESVAWCPQDPVCIESVLDSDRRIAGACHQCCLVPETSCELFNQYLDRSALIGSESSRISPVLGEFLFGQTH